MKVFILTEGGKGIGLGHIARCTSLYQAFRKREISVQFMINGGSGLKSLLKGKDCRIFNWLKEKEELFKRVKGADIVVVDSYLANLEFYKEISAITKMPVFIDDNRRIDYPKGIILNGAVCCQNLYFPGKKNMEYLLGAKYIPLREEFWEMPEREIKKNIESIMITFGGDDSRNMTLKVLKLLEENYPEVKKKVVIGKVFQNADKIKEASRCNVELFYGPDAKVMRKIMRESDIAVSAGGQTLYELARVGVATIAIAVVKNQLNNVKGLEKIGFIKYAGWWQDQGIMEEVLKKAKSLESYEAREKISRVTRELIDGRGCLRVVDFLKNKAGAVKSFSEVN